MIVIDDETQCLPAEPMVYNCLKNELKQDLFKLGWLLYR